MSKPPPMPKLPPLLIKRERILDPFFAALPLEALMPVPVRPRDDLDIPATLHRCPVCDARVNAPCSWAKLFWSPSWNAHEGRRVLVKG